MISDGRQFLPYDKNEPAFNRHNKDMRKFRKGHGKIEPGAESITGVLAWLKLLPHYRASLNRYIQN